MTTAEQGIKAIPGISVLRGGQLADVRVVVSPIDPCLSGFDRVFGARADRPETGRSDRTFTGEEKGPGGGRGAANFQKIVTRRIWST